MPLYGKHHDVNLVKSLNREITNVIIGQEIGYYKHKIDQINTNVYGESSTKTFIGPVLIQCLIQRGDFDWKVKDSSNLPDIDRSFEFRFVREDLTEADVLPEVGDVILYNEDYYEVDATNENRLFTGKDQQYSYSIATADFGASLHIICKAHLSRIEKLGIVKDRL